MKKKNYLIKIILSRISIYDWLLIYNLWKKYLVLYISEQDIICYNFVIIWHSYSKKFWSTFWYLLCADRSMGGNNCARRITSIIELLIWISLETLSKCKYTFYV